MPEAEKTARLNAAQMSFKYWNQLSFKTNCPLCSALPVEQKT
jgi:hypothetical protein